MSELLPGIILASTLRGTVLIAVALLCGPWLRRYFGRNAAHWLWLAVLPVLLWPLPPRTAFSLQKLWAAKKSAPAAEAAPLAPRVAPLVVGTVRKFAGKMPEAAPQPAPNHLPATKPEAMHRPEPMNLGRWLFALWLTGAILGLAQLCWRWLRTLRMLRGARPVTEGRVMQVLRCYRSWRPIGLAITSTVRAPALAGLWRPRILIPEGWLEELPAAELESVLLHELGHHRRGDLVWEWLFAVARCLHWMNPAVWLAERWSRRERELACDAWALERTANPAHYGEALLEALKRVQRCPVASFGVVAMADDVHQIARRLEWISQYRPAPRWRALAAWIPALAVLVAVGSDPQAVEPEKPAVPSAPTASAAPEIAKEPATPEAAPLAGEPLPLAKRSVEITMRLLRVPEAIAKQIGWPIADDGSKGIQQVLSQADFLKVSETLRSAPGVELLPAPRLVSRNGHRDTAQAVREFRYGASYKPGAKPGVLIPTKIETVNLGLTITWQADIKDETTTHLNVLPELTRLLGFAEAGGKLTRTLVPPAGTDWYRRLTAYEMPVGAGGLPSFLTQKGNAELDLNSTQVALVFGFRDADQTAASGGGSQQTMINYFAVQTEILP